MTARSKIKHENLHTTVALNTNNTNTDSKTAQNHKFHLFDCWWIRHRRSLFHVFGDEGLSDGRLRDSYDALFVVAINGVLSFVKDCVAPRMI